MATSGIVVSVEDYRNKLFSIIVGNLETYELSVDAYNYLFERVHEAVLRMQGEGKLQSRALEVEENCRLFGQQLKQRAAGRLIPRKTIGTRLINKTLAALCPSLYPFC
jgi:hypothetical protein